LTAYEYCNGNVFQKIDFSSDPPNRTKKVTVPTINHQNRIIFILPYVKALSIRLIKKL